MENSLRCFLNPFVIFLIHPIIQIYQIAENTFKKITSQLLLMESQSYCWK